MQLSSVLRSIIFSVLFTNSLSNAVVTKRSNPKRGIAFAQNNGDDVHYLRGTQVSWSYNWYHSPTYLAPDVTGMPFIPMLWGPEGKVEFADRVISQGANIVLVGTTGSLINGYAHTCLTQGFNEPDLEAQANMSAEGAAWVWQTYIDPLKYKGVRLGAPAVTSRPEGREWLRRFFSACTNCTIDFIPVHWFGPTLGEFYDYIWSIHYEYPQHKIWVTEVSPPQRSPTGTPKVYLSCDTPTLTTDSRNNSIPIRGYGIYGQSSGLGRKIFLVCVDCWSHFLVFYPEHVLTHYLSVRMKNMVLTNFVCSYGPV
jgi:hypothetical protein